MDAHELARRLLALDDLPVRVERIAPGSEGKEVGAVFEDEGTDGHFVIVQTA